MKRKMSLLALMLVVVLSLSIGQAAVAHDLMYNDTDEVHDGEGALIIPTNVILESLSEELEGLEFDWTHDPRAQGDVIGMQSPPGAMDPGLLFYIDFSGVDFTPNAVTNIQYVGGSAQLGIANHSNLEIVSVTWSESGMPGVLQISPTGYATAIGAGEMVIHARIEYMNPDARVRHISSPWWVWEAPERVPQPPVPGALFRLYNPNNNRHLFTVDVNEYNYLVSVGWNGEGVAWITPSSGVPVRRLFHPGLDAHHFTKDVHEYNVLTGRGWLSEGTLFYSYEGPTRVGKHRLFNPFDLRHLYTASDHEREVLTGLGWIYEGTGFYGLP